MNKFFIMTRGRTGSSAIIDELNKTNNVRTAQELFTKMDPRRKRIISANMHPLILPMGLWKNNGSWLERLPKRMATPRKLIKRYLEEFESSVSPSEIGALGFKVLSQHFDENPELKDSLLDRGYRAMYLTRNIPRQVISGMVAKLRGKYNTKGDYEDNARYVLDQGEYESLVQWEAQSVQNDILLLEKDGFEHIQITYEEFMVDRKGFFGRVMDFLEVPVELPEASTYSIMIKDLRHTVENYDDIEAATEAMGMRIQ